MSKKRKHYLFGGIFFVIFNIIGLLNSKHQPDDSIAGWFGALFIGLCGLSFIIYALVKKD